VGVLLWGRGGKPLFCPPGKSQKKKVGGELSPQKRPRWSNGSTLAAERTGSEPPDPFGNFRENGGHIVESITTGEGGGPRRTGRIFWEGSSFVGRMGGD